MTSTGPDDPMERIRAVFEQPYPALPIPPGTWERIETEARRRRRTRRLQVVGSVAASLLVVGAGVGLLWPQNQAPVGPGGPGTATSATTAPSPSDEPSTSPSTGSPTPSSPSSTGSGVLDGLPKGGAVPKGFLPSSLSGTAGGFLYVLGDAPGCGNPVCTSMVRSLDGGKTWDGIPAPVAEVGGDTPDAVREIRFATPKDGYAYGPTLFETHDGGATWTRRKLAGQVLDLAVAGDRVWVVTATCDGNGCTGPQLRSAPATGGDLAVEPGVKIPGPVTVARLTDGGGTLALRVDGQGGTGQWVLQQGSRWRPATDPCAAITDFPLSLTQLAPAADGSGLLAALCAGAGPNGTPVMVVTSSQDGGQKWSSGGLRPVPSGQLLLAVADRDRLVVAGEPDGTGPAVLVSRDGGLTWDPATGDVPPKGSYRWLGAGGAGQVYAFARADGLLYRSGSGTSFSSRPIR